MGAGWGEAEGGILVRCPAGGAPARLRERFADWLGALGLAASVATRDEPGAVRFRLCAERLPAWTPEGDTLDLCATLSLDPVNRPGDLVREVLVAMLAGPVAFEFPTFEELASAVRIRCNIVEAARRTALDFATGSAERPEDCWTYAEGRGFTLLPGVSLVDALRKATQPEVSGQTYSFSCYRATEYVILLGIAEELRVCNPALLHRLQRQWETRAIMSGQFHDVFLREYGSMEAPLPPRYYVPGDRLWFRNPDENSSDVTGFEGSWVFYLGQGLFSNFWKRDQPFTLDAKCLEIYHWRHGTYRDAAGELQMDEEIVAARVRDTLSRPAEVADILARMGRLREARGSYGLGGCIDTTREYPRWVCPGTTDLVLPMQ